MIDAWEREALARMTEPEIRRAQALVAAQIPMAHEQRNDAALATLRGWEDAYSNELLRRLDETVKS